MWRRQPALRDSGAGVVSRDAIEADFTWPSMVYQDSETVSRGFVPVDGDKLHYNVSEASQTAARCDGRYAVWCDA